MSGSAVKGIPPFVIDRWITGLYTRRSQLFVPLRAIGVQVQAYHDALIDGSNVEVSDNYTLQRRPGFPRFSTAQFGVNEWPLQFYSFRNLNSQVFSLVDTQNALYTFTSTAKTSIVSKTTTAQGFVQEVGNTLYYANGVDLKKWNGTTTTNWGIAAPVTAPTLSYLPNGQLSPVAGYSYVYCGRNSSTQHVSTASPASGNTGPLKQQTVTEQQTIPGSPFQVTVNHASTFTADISVTFASNSTQLTKVPSSPAAGQYSVTGTGIYTFNSADTGKSVVFSYTYALAVSTAMNIQVSGSGLGDAQVDFIDIFRNVDGGPDYFYLASVANPGAGNTWNYTDSSLDSSLNKQRLAPLAHLNDPPPSGLTVLAFWQGRIWGAIGNKVQFTGGPDVLNGVSEECWPPANVFTFPSQVYGLIPTSVGLLLFTADEVHMILGGPQTLTFYSQFVMSNFGISSPNCIAHDGDTIYVYTTSRQFYSLDASGKSEEGWRIGDLLQSGFDPTKAYVTMYRNGEDTGVFLSDGSTTILRYSLNLQAWSPKAQIVGGVGAIKAIETGLGTYSLMAGRGSGSGYMLSRNLSTFADDGNTYTAFVVIGSIQISPPGYPLIPLCHVVGYFTQVGSVPSVSVLFNEIAASPGLGFIILPKALNEPPVGASPSQTLMSFRWPTNLNQERVSQLAHHVQVKISFPSENAQNELLVLALKYDQE